MYLTVREILAGLAGHSGATRATVMVMTRDDCLSLRVTSDGHLDNKAGVPRGYRPLSTESKRTAAA